MQEPHTRSKPLEATRSLAEFQDPTGALSRIDRLVAALRDPACYPHPVSQVEVLETHISYVLLTGEFAYKIKKPVNLGFLDFSTLEARRRCCERELQLNRRTAPRLYLAVVPISGSESEPVLGRGPAIEYAVKMSQFSQDALLDHMARRGLLAPRQVDALAGIVAVFHQGIARAGTDSPYGTKQRVLAAAVQNFEQMLEVAESDPDRAMLIGLRDWTLVEHDRAAAVIESRKREGYVRECHGDLHLGNIALLEGLPTPFDCIEFNDDFRWTDVMAEVAFLVMDLLDHGLAAHAHRFLNGYLEVTGDYCGLRLLRFYFVYRALVRAKVACIRAHQPHIGAEDKVLLGQKFRRHLRLAQRMAGYKGGALIILHGVSGSGKSTVAQSMLEILGAVRLRSDLERKRLHGLTGQVRSGSGVGAGIYAPASTGRTYDRLAALAREVSAAGYPVIIDAAFLSQGRREEFRGLARDLAVPFAILDCVASEGAIRRRIEARELAGADISEAGIPVLEHQLATREPLAPEEIACTLQIDTELGAEAVFQASRELAQRLGMSAAVLSGR